MTPFITSKYGKINSLRLYHYSYSFALLNQPNMLISFRNWLKSNDELIISVITDKGFISLTQISKEESRQYSLIRIEDLNAPFTNTQLISRYLANIVHKDLSRKFKRFFKNNEYVFNKVSFDLFKLYKCIGFSIEVFETGTFLINFCPQTRITSKSILTETYVDSIIREYRKNQDTSSFNVVELDRLRRIRIDLNSEKTVSLLKEYLRSGKKLVGTFDYNFISSYSKSLLYQIMSATRKDINDKITDLEKFIKSIDFDPQLNLYSKPFLRVEIESFGQENNLVIGSQSDVKKQSAAYHLGVFRPAEQAIVQPFLYNAPYPELFTELFEKFNGTAPGVVIKQPIQLENSNSNFEELFSSENQTRSRYICPIFSQANIPDDFLESFKVNRINYQIYSGKAEPLKLSNFTVRCIEKLGGLLSIIKDNEVSEKTYFIGIDLGHNRVSRTSRIAFSFFNYQGELVHYNVSEEIQLNEALTSDIWQNLDGFRSLYKSGKIAAPERIIVHRDGRLHSGDIQLLVDHIERHFDVYEIDILEIIKSGYPIIAGFDAGEYVNLNSGDAYVDELNKYAILVTNTQSSLTNSLVKPIIIKHKYGEEMLSKLVKQVFWFTKVYTNNLYRSTRLPATTLKANNIVGTGDKGHLPSYLG